MLESLPRKSKIVNRLPAVLGFVVLAFLCWGSYGPVLHIGQEAMQGERLRPFIAVGIAYFFVAVVIPLIVGPRLHEPGRWTMRGILWALFAGTLGALGSLGVIFAFSAGGTLVFVMPLMFGCAPVVNTLVTLVASKSTAKPSLAFYLAIALVALGAAGVLKFKPQSPVAATAPSESSSHESSGAVSTTSETGQAQTWLGWLGTVAAIVMTAVCWGSYGPALHQGQAAMSGSRLRPFMCVGIAYFLVAIITPAAILTRYPESGGWTTTGVVWSLAAGSLGAFGALGVIMAFTFGGKPSYVMPLVFGGAPVVNTATSMGQAWYEHGTVGDVGQWFLIALGMVTLGAVLVLLFAPQPPSTPAVADEPTPS